MRKRFTRSHRQYHFEANNNSQMNNSSSSNIVIRKDPSQFAGWSLYFPTCEFNNSCFEKQWVECFKIYFKESDILSRQEKILEERCIKVDMDILINAELRVNCQEFANIQDALYNDPVRIRNAIGLACHQIILENELRKCQSISELFNVGYTITNPEIPMIYAELIHWPCGFTRIRNIKAQSLGKLVCIYGTVSSITGIRPSCSQLAFRCTKCGSNFAIIQSKRGRQIKYPTQCINRQCRSLTFTSCYDSNLTFLIDYQSIRVQSHQDDIEDRNEDRIPRSIEVDLVGPLVDRCSPGDIVTVCGVVKIKEDTNQPKCGNFFKPHNQTVSKESFTLCIDAFSIECEQGHHVAESINDMSLKDLYGIRKLHAEGHNLMRLLVASLCPSIYGYNIVKAGVLLSLFSGKYAVLNSQDSNSRTNIHCLLVGDPGTGKSQLLKACVTLSPRSIYVCGNTSTTAGLTVSIGRFNQNSDYAVESGALVMADGGVCCIDELDKIAHASLLEAMEQQRVSVAKAGVVCSVPSRCSVIAAANPSCGHYDQSRSLLDNIKLKPALISRFDLIFLMVDQPNTKADIELSRFIMNKYDGAKHVDFVDASSTPHSSIRSSAECQSNLELRLSIPADKQDIVPCTMIRKYIAYSLKYVNPVLTTEASNILKEFYLQARQNQDSNAIPITLRFLESLIRLCKARARLFLRNECIAEDADDAVSIVQHCLDQLSLRDISGFSDKHTVNKSGSSKTKARKKFVQLIRTVTAHRKNDHFTNDELKEISENAGLDFDEFESTVLALNECGVLIKRGRNLYQFTANN
ncbi:hypothetical protein GJ496_009299 [Pomphorhynchus laevis]|nr:hypothetical protein GJ496_009299 [Pomphorhynchus laevis]